MSELKPHNPPHPAPALLPQPGGRSYPFVPKNIFLDLPPRLWALSRRALQNPELLEAEGPPNPA